MKKFIGLMSLLTLMLTITHSLSLDLEPPYRNIMYYGEWSIYSGQRNFYPSKIDANLITHLAFSFLDMDSNGDLVLHDEYADFQIVNLPELEGIKFANPYAGIIGSMSILKVNNPHLKLGISVGGPARSGKFSEISKNKTARQNFAYNIAKFINYIGFDFVDINLEERDENGIEVIEEYPGNQEDSENFVLLLKEIRNELNKLEKNKIRYELSVAIPVSPERMALIQYDKVLEVVTFANLITYNLNGAWNSYTVHHTPLYTNKAYNQDTIIEAQLSIDDCINYLEDTYGTTIDMSKITIGVAPYTHGWSGVEDNGLDKNNPGLYATALPNSVRSADGTTSGIYGFHELPSLIKQFALVEYYDKVAEAVYYYSPTTGYFFTCDNEESVAAKGKYVKEKGLGGLFMWMASYDRENIITKVMFNSLYEEGYTFPKRDLIYNLISISATIKATETGYDFTIQNNAIIEETNPALKYAELFRKSILNMKVYIRTKNATEFSPGLNSGNITHENGEIIIDPSSNYDSRIIAPNYRRYTFSVKISGTPTVDNIKSIFVSQRILPSLKEFKKRIIYGTDV